MTRDYRLKYYMNVLGKLCLRTADEYNSLIIQDCRDNGESESAAKEIIKQKVKEAIVSGKSSYRLSYGFPLIIIKEYLDEE